MLFASCFQLDLSILEKPPPPLLLTFLLIVKENVITYFFFLRFFFQEKIKYEKHLEEQSVSLSL